MKPIRCYPERASDIVTGVWRSWLLLVAGGGLGVAMVAWDVTRLWGSPIQGSAAWIVGALVGLALGAAATSGWIRLMTRRPRPADTPWWMWATAVVWVAALAGTHGGGRGSPAPPVTDGYTAAGLGYDIAGFIGTGTAVLVALAGSRRRPRPRIESSTAESGDQP
jgi:hypothetical protein